MGMLLSSRSTAIEWCIPVVWPWTHMKNGYGECSVSGQAEVGEDVGARFAAEDEFFDRSVFGWSRFHRDRGFRSMRSPSGNPTSSRTFGTQSGLPFSDISAVVRHRRRHRVHEMAVKKGG